MKKSYAQLAKGRRESLKQRGLCIDCGKLPSEINKTRCLDCLTKTRAANSKYWKTNTKAKEVKKRWKANPQCKIFRDMLKNPTRHKLRILCANCHFAITNLGTCPYKEHDHGLPEV